MTAYELRRHLSARHHIDLRGQPYDQLLAIHDHEHLAAQDHAHDEAGHSAPDWLYTLAMILVVLAAMHYLGIRL